MRSVSLVTKKTIGLLQRRHIKIDLIKSIGKESNSLEAVDEGLEHSQKNVYTEYVDLKRDEWSTKILPALKKVPLKTLVTTCKGRPSRSTIIELRAGRSRPHPKTKELLVGFLKKLKTDFEVKMQRHQLRRVGPGKPANR